MLTRISSSMITNYNILSSMTIIYNFVRWSLGSPADRYCLSALKWIVQVNGKPTSDLDAFANVVKVWLQFFQPESISSLIDITFLSE